MYWTWQSGYINFKLEGRSPVCPTRNHAFQYHIGGYSFPYNALQHVVLPVSEGEGLVIQVAIDSFLEDVDLKNEHSVMSPNAQSMELAKRIPEMFSQGK